MEPTPVSQKSSMCQLQKRRTLELSARRLGPALPCRTAALDPFYRSVKIPQAPINGCQVVFDPGDVLEVDGGLGLFETVCRQQAFESHLESAPKRPHRGNVDLG